MRKKEKSSMLSYGNIGNKRRENLLKMQKSMIGIDIGFSAIKIVQIKNNKVVKCGMKTIPEGMMNQGRIMEPSQLVSNIKLLLKENKISGDLCAICISGNEIIVREMKLPEMNENQIMENVRQEITSFLPINQEEYIVDYKILDYIEPKEGVNGKLKIMVAAVPNSMAQSYLDVLKMANLKICYIDVFPNIAGKLAQQITSGKAGNIGIIDFGAYSTNFIITKDGNYILHKTMTNGGDYLTTQISKKYNIDMLDAEEMKKKKDFFVNNYQNGENRFVETYMNYLVTDMERTIDFFKNNNNQVGLDSIYITGGGSLLKGLPAFLNQHLNLEINHLSNALRQYTRNNSTSDEMAFYAHAIGSTLREE